MSTTYVNLNAARDSYKNYHDLKIETTTNIAPGQFVFLYKPPQEAASNEIRTKLLPRSIAPIIVLSATPKTFTADENDDYVSNTVSLDRVTLSPNGRINVTDGTALQRSSLNNTQTAI